MAAELDALSLNITASSKDAEKKIDDLIGSLKRLNTAFTSLTGSTTYATNLESAVHAITRVSNAIKNIDAAQVKSVASALKSLSTSSKSLSEVGSNVSFAKVSDQAKEEADTIAKAFGITGKKGVKELETSITNLQNVLGDSAKTSEAVSQIETIIRKYAQLDTTVGETYRKIREYISNTKLYLPEGLISELGDDFKSQRAKIGISNTTTDITKGTDIQFALNEMNDALGDVIEVSNTAQGCFRNLFEYLNNSSNAMATFNDGMINGRSAVELLEQSVQSLLANLGQVELSAEQLDAAYSKVDYTQFENDADFFAAMGQEAIKASDSVNAINNALSQTQQTVQPFEQIVSGLESLQGVTIGDFSNIKTLAEGVNKLGYQSAVTAAQILPQIAEGLSSFDFKLPDMTGMEEFTKGLRSLGSKAVQNAAYSLPFVADGLKQLSGIKLPEMTNLTEFAQALSVFGRQTSERAVANIPKLAQAFEQLFRALSKAPTISRNTIDAANAMANLASRTGSVTNALSRATPRLNLWSGAARSAQKHTFSLAQAIGKVYASYWMLFRAFGMIKKSINIASDLTEVRNVVVQAFGDMAYKANEFAEVAGNSFGMSKLEALDAASRYQAMGKTMGITNNQVVKANDFLKEKLKDTLSIKEVQQAYGDLGDTAADMSINLTKLGGDLASLYNTDIEVAAEKLNSIFTGTTKPLRDFGFDLTQATLQEWAMKNGIDANVKSMTQAQKALLRYQYVMANASFVMGDFVRTSDSWHNTIVKLKLAFQNLGSVIGQGFINLLKPAIQKITAFVNTLTKLVEKAINAIGKLLGWQVEIDPVKPTGDLSGGGNSGADEDMSKGAGGAGEAAEDAAEATEDADDAAKDYADNMDKAQKAAKKLKDYMLGIDELNVFQPDTDNDTDNTKDKTKKDKAKKDKADKDKGGSGSGSGADAGGAGDGGATGGEVKFQKYKSLIDGWYDLGKTIADTIGDALWGIDWKSIQKKAEQAAANLAKFLNGIFASKKLWTGIGHTIAEGLNTALSFLEKFIDLFNWGAAGRRIGDMINQAVSDFKWVKLGRTLAKGINAAFEFMWNLGMTFDAEKLGQGIASAINEFFAKLDAHWIARGLNIWVDKIKQLIVTTISNIKWGDAFGKIKDIFSELDVDTLVVLFGAVAWKLAGKALTYKVVQELLVSNLLGGAKDLILSIPKLFVEFGSMLLKGFSATSLAATLSQELMGLKVALPQIFKLYLVEPITAFISGTAIPAITSAFGSIGGAIGLTGSAAVLGGAAIVAAAVIGAIAIIFNWDKIKKMRLGDTLAKIIKDAFIELPKKLGELGKSVGDAIGNAVKSGLELAFIKIPSFFAHLDIMGAFHGLGEKIGSVFGNVVKLAITGIVGLLAVDGGIIESIKSFVSNLVVSFVTAVSQADWSTIGLNILKGIVFIFTIPGQVIAAIGEALVGLFTGIYDGICQAFGINSPAEKMKPLGGYILLGIVEGFKSKMGDFVKALNDWYNNSVKPWFSLDKWKALGQNILTGIISKWNDFKTQWISSINNWWTQNVVPWFNLEKWKSEADHLREAIITKFNDMVTQWRTDIEKWWNEYVVAKFELGKWKAEADHLREAIISKLTEMVSEWHTKIESWWKEHVLKYFDAQTWVQFGENIKKGILDGIDAIAKEWKGKIEKLIEQFQEVFKESTFVDIGKKAITAVVEGFKSIDVISLLSGWAEKIRNWLQNVFTVKAKVETDGAGSGDGGQQQGGKEKNKNKGNATTRATGGVFDDGRWRNIHAYGTGGMPDEGQLFWAREAGAELVGQIGGNTAVMNNDQIVASVAAGVQQAVTEALTPYLADISTNTRVTANKDFTVQIGDRQIAEANNRGQRAIGAVLFT